MDFLPGGHMFNYMQMEKRFDVERVRFYVSQIALALEHLHMSNIMYRDLKPENILMEADGYIKLSDFGLAKNTDMTSSVCGTPEYISPEILANQSYNAMTDWWSLGILTYEMLCGIPPFYDKNQLQMFQNIKQSQVPWPDQAIHGFSIDPIAMDFVTKILNKNPRKRLGSKGANEVLSHPFLNISLEDR
jgi:serine/threonine protein kinase